MSIFFFVYYLIKIQLQFYNSICKKFCFAIYYVSICVCVRARLQNINTLFLLQFVQVLIYLHVSKLIIYFDMII